MSVGKTIEMQIAGFGLIFYSPFCASNIGEGEDYLESDFLNPTDVEAQALQGRIVGVSTSSPGKFILVLHEGYPANEMVDDYKYKLRIAVEVRDRTLCIRDLFDLIDWSAECPREQKLDLDDGFYHITLLSNDPESGILGDDQEVLVYLNKLDEMPKMRYNGVPTLCE